MKFYAIEFDDVEDNFSDSGHYINSVVVGRKWYVSSTANSVDPTDVAYAKLFPNMRGVKQALQWAGDNPRVFEVETSVNVIGEVKI